MVYPSTPYSKRFAIVTGYWLWPVFRVNFQKEYSTSFWNSNCVCFWLWKLLLMLRSFALGYFKSFVLYYKLVNLTDGTRTVSCNWVETMRKLLECTRNETRMHISEIHGPFNHLEYPCGTLIRKWGEPCRHIQRAQGLKSQMGLFLVNYSHEIWIKW